MEMGWRCFKPGKALNSDLPSPSQHGSLSLVQNLFDKDRQLSGSEERRETEESVKSLRDRHSQTISSVI